MRDREDAAPAASEALPSGRGALATDLGVIGAFALLTLVMTWPWVAHLADHAADRADSYIETWILWRDFAGTFSDPRHLFDGNIFFPHRLSLAFSENDYGVALPLFPLYALGIAPLTAHGVAILLGFVLSGYGAFRLARTLTASTAAAWFAGIAFAFVPYRFAHLNHVVYLSAGWIALALEAAVLFARRPSRGRAAWLLAAVVMNGLSSITWLLFSALPFGATLLLTAWRSGTLVDRRFLARGALALGGAGLALALFLAPYREAARVYAFVRSEDEVRFFSATPRNWIQVSAENGVWKRFKRDGNQDRALSPGLLLLLAPAAALALAFTRRRPDGLTAAVGLACALPGFLGSLGTNAPFHPLLYHAIPLFRSVRVPMRWAMVGILGLALLAAAVLAGLSRRGRIGALTAALVFLFLVEARCFPLHLIRGPAEPDDATRFLASAPMRGGIACLPTSDDALALYDLRAADHRRPLITAISGFEPPEARRIRELGLARPIPKELLERLEAAPASYLVVYESLLAADDVPAVHAFLAEAVDTGRLRFLRRFSKPAVEVYAFARTEPGIASAGAPPWRAAVAAREDPSLTGAIDAPAPGAVVKGSLVVRGWARIPGRDLEVTVLLDGEEVKPASLRRFARPDVAAVIATLAPAQTAGWEAVFPPPAGARTVEITAIFASGDGRVRHYAPVTIRWVP